MEVENKNKYEKYDELCNCLDTLDPKVTIRSRLVGEIGYFELWKDSPSIHEAKKRITESELKTQINEVADDIHDCLYFLCKPSI